MKLTLKNCLTSRPSTLWAEWSSKRPLEPLSVHLSCLWVRRNPKGSLESSPVEQALSDSSLHLLLCFCCPFAPAGADAGGDIRDPDIDRSRHSLLDLLGATLPRLHLRLCLRPGQVNRLAKVNRPGHGLLVGQHRELLARRRQALRSPANRCP